MCPSQSITSGSVVITFSSGRFLEPFVRVSTEVHHSRAGNAAPSSPLSWRIGQCPPLPGDHVLTGANVRGTILAASEWRPRGLRLRITIYAPTRYATPSPRGRDERTPGR